MPVPNKTMHFDWQAWAETGLAMGQSRVGIAAKVPAEIKIQTMGRTSLAGQPRAERLLWGSNGCSSSCLPTVCCPLCNLYRQVMIQLVCWSYYRQAIRQPSLRWDVWNDIDVKVLWKIVLELILEIGNHRCRGAQAPQRPIINYSVEQHTWYPRTRHRLQSARQAVGIGPRPS